MQSPHHGRSNHVQEYRQNSRLSKLGEMKAKAEAIAQEAAHRQPASANSKTTSSEDRVVVHVDFDSFFVSVSIAAAKNLHLDDKPVGVSHCSSEKSTGALASCNYSARQHGLHNGMRLLDAYRLCPDLQVLPYDFDAYEEASAKFHEIVNRREFSDKVRVQHTHTHTVLVHARTGTRVHSGAGDNCNSLGVHLSLSLFPSANLKFPTLVVHSR